MEMTMDNVASVLSKATEEFESCDTGQTQSESTGIESEDFFDRSKDGDWLLSTLPENVPDEFESAVGSKPTSRIERAGPRPQITVNAEELTVNDQAVAALAYDSELYQRSHTLVRVILGSENKDLQGVANIGDQPVISPVKKGTLRERLTTAAKFVKRNGEGSFVAAHPPGWCVEAVLLRGQWPGIRQLVGAVNSPVLRPDGTILGSRGEGGYDEATRLFCAPNVTVDVPDRPTRRDAEEALKTLLDPFQDFDFERPEHRSAYLAALLTPAARPAIKGPVPLFLIDANVQGSGKSRLVDCISLIHTGFTSPRKSLPESDTECRKMITTFLMASVRMVLLDNIGEGGVQLSSLDALLTSETWTDRKLGVNEGVTLPNGAVWFGSGKNVTLSSDMARRVMPIRLQVDHENPEIRTDFRYTDLLGHVEKNREQLLSAVLTILRAYIVAGSPTFKLPGIGSFEGWSSIVRNAIVWLGEPDPAKGRAEMRARSDSTRGALSTLFEQWQEGGFNGCSAAEVLRVTEASPNKYDALREAIADLCPGPPNKPVSARTLGNKLRGYKGRVVGGRRLDNAGSNQGTAVWRITQVEAPPMNDSVGESRDSRESSTTLGTF
jgi:hypothetical protein